MWEPIRRTPDQAEPGSENHCKPRFGIFVGGRIDPLRGWENNTLNTGPEHCVLDTGSCMLAVSRETKRTFSLNNEEKGGSAMKYVLSVVVLLLA